MSTVSGKGSSNWSRTLARIYQEKYRYLFRRSQRESCVNIIGKCTLLSICTCKFANGNTDSHAYSLFYGLSLGTCLNLALGIISFSERILTRCNQDIWILVQLWCCISWRMLIEACLNPTQLCSAQRRNPLLPADLRERKVSIRHQPFPLAVICDCKWKVQLCISCGHPFCRWLASQAAELLTFSVSCWCAVIYSKSRMQQCTSYWVILLIFCARFVSCTRWNGNSRVDDTVAS